MRKTSKLLALTLAVGLQPAMAGTVTLDFNDVTATAPLTNQYAGAPWFVEASGAAWAAANVSCFPNDPIAIAFPGAGNCGALWLAEPNDNQTSSMTLKVGNGFDALSFIYAGSNGDSKLSVSIYDAAGLLLSSLDNLGAQSCGGDFFCVWSSEISLTGFKGASTVKFEADNQAFLLDNLSFTTNGAGGQLPEPGGVALALGALGALGWTRKRSSR